VQQRLSLARTAVKFAWRTVLLELPDVSLNRAPAFDLPFIIN
jgi:hypothetical protein